MNLRCWKSATIVACAVAWGGCTDEATRVILVTVVAVVLGVSALVVSFTALLVVAARRKGRSPWTMALFAWGVALTSFPLFVAREASDFTLDTHQSDYWWSVWCVGVGVLGLLASAFSVAFFVRGRPARGR